ncbi:protein kinase [Nocardia sp. NPDC059177]|uniref:serine/threonine-protein kinase n=1 Tax=Nocardia sp. NPDC059177 TaxID=3346759 RepID=UPI0036C7C49E
MRFNSGVLRSGEVFAGYTIVKLLGAGGMGEVYAAQHPRLPRTDALKVLTAPSLNDQSFRQRFDREADLMARLSHPNIVTIHDRGVSAGRPWLTMELIAGQSLQNRLHQSPRGLPAAEVRAVALAMAAALDYAGGFSLLHRDVKPANILIDHHQRAMLTDFGIARLASDAGLTETGMAVGTLSYSSPEQLFGQCLDSRADQYSLAATIFGLLTGHPPFRGTTPAQVISDHLSTPVPSVRFDRPELSEAVDRILARGMAKNPADRYGTCGQFAAALSEALRTTLAEATVIEAHEPAIVDRNFVPTPQLPHSSSVPKRTGTRTTVMAVCVVAALALVTGGGFALWRLLDHGFGPRAIAAESTENLTRRPAGTLLRSLADKPAGPHWTLTPQVWGSSSPDYLGVTAVGGDSRHVAFLANDWLNGDRFWILMVDATTGTSSWPAPVEVPVDSSTRCGITESRSAVACVTRRADNHRLLILDGSTGVQVADIPFGNDSLRLDVSGESILVQDYSDTPELTAYRADGSVAWSLRDFRAAVVYAEQGIVVVNAEHGGHGSAQVLRLDTGAQLFSTPGEVDVFADGFAVSVPRNGGAPVDFFSLAGIATATGHGWSVFPVTPDDKPAALPVLRRSDKMSAEDAHFGVVNPMTGRQLWEFQQYRGERTMPVGSFLVVGDRTLIVYDIYTGQALGSPLTIRDGIDAVLGTDDSAIAFAEADPHSMAYAIVVYDAATGAQRWRFSGKGKPVTIGDGIYQGANRIV